MCLPAALKARMLKNAQPVPTSDVRMKFVIFRQTCVLDGVGLGRANAFCFEVLAGLASIAQNIETNVGTNCSHMGVGTLYEFYKKGLDRSYNLW